jgi:hypothetical protein
MMVDPHSQTWLAVLEAARQQMHIARVRLEKPGLSPVDTEFERGRIAALTALVGIAEPLPKIQKSDLAKAGSLY